MSKILVEVPLDKQYQVVRDQVAETIKQGKQDKVLLGQMIDRVTDLFMHMATDLSAENVRLGIEYKKLEKQLKAEKLKDNQRSFI